MGITKHCEIKHTDGRIIKTWLLSARAIVGMRIKIRHNKAWEGGWTVINVGEEV